MQAIYWLKRVFAADRFDKYIKGVKGCQILKTVCRQ